MKINQLSFLLFAAVLLFSCGKTILPSMMIMKTKQKSTHLLTHLMKQRSILFRNLSKETLGIMEFGYMVILLVLANEVSSRLNGKHLSRMTLQSY